MTAILIVEDEPAILRLQQELFLGQGFTVYTAQTIAEAEAVLAAHSIDVLFADVRVDGRPTAGVDLAYRAQAADDHLAVALCSGYPTAAREDCVHWPLVTKPFTMEIALQTVQKAIDIAKQAKPRPRNR
jgi:DNA-binding NtrC family response regulator